MKVVVLTAPHMDVRDGWPKSLIRRCAALRQPYEVRQMAKVSQTRLYPLVKLCVIKPAFSLVIPHVVHFAPAFALRRYTGRTTTRHGYSAVVSVSPAISCDDLLFSFMQTLRPLRASLRSIFSRGF